MQFNSVSFLFYFLPLFLAVYYIFPLQARKYVLTLGSLIFYACVCWGKPWCLAILVILTLLTYLFGLAIPHKYGRWLFVPACIVLVGILVFFKWYRGGTLLPVGMSFYLFQMLAYLADVFRGVCPVERNLMRCCVQTMQFPKLLSGPIARPAELKTASESPCWCLPAFHWGCQDLILGLGFKTLLAAPLGALWARAGIAGLDSISTPFAWMALIAYALSLYFDFYGYSLIAMGLARMLGYHLPANFRDPYAARSVSEFYRRWHITLGLWFRNYVYIPLGGSRNGTLRLILSLSVTWILTGLWHGTGGNYLIWAGFLLLCILGERLLFGRFLQKSAVISHIYTVFAILLSWIPFAIGDRSTMLIFLQKLFGCGPAALNAKDFLPWGREYGMILLAGVFFALPLSTRIIQKLRKSVWGDLLLFILFWIEIYWIATSAQNPFLYFSY